MIKVGNLVKQGQCKKCRIPLFGYSEKRRYLCGDCSGGKGNYPRKIVDHVAKAPTLDETRTALLLQNQVDDLKRQVRYWKSKAV